MCGVSAERWPAAGESGRALSHAYLPPPPPHTHTPPLRAAYDHAKRHYYVSLRSDSDEVDVSVIAKSLGGGGHRRASGFTCERLEDVLVYEDGTPVGQGKAKEGGGGASSSGGAGSKRAKVEE